MRFRALVTGVLLGGVFLAPALSHAAPLPFLGPIIPTDYNSCAASWGLVLVVINNLIRFGISVVLVIVAPLMFVYAGGKLVTSSGSAGARSEVRKMLLNLVSGIVITLAAWLIVGAVMAVFYHPTDSALGTWTTLLSGGTVEKCIPLKAGLHQTPGGTPYTGIEGDGVTVVPQVGPGQYTHAEAMAVLQEHGNISVVSSGGCSDPTNPRCTSLSSIPRDAIANIITIQTKCNCNITITGGTETGHKSHGTGLPIVDFNYSDSLLAGIRAAGYALNANFQRGATCEPPGQPGVAMTCGPGTGHIHMEL